MPIELPIESDFDLNVTPLPQKGSTFQEQQDQYLQSQFASLVNLHNRKIDLKEFDSVQVKWEGSSSTAVKGTIVISKGAIRDKEFLDWISNRDLYEIWEKR